MTPSRALRLATLALLASCTLAAPAHTQARAEGGWTGPDYAVAYAIGDSPFGPFERIGKILQQDSTVATGAGHHSVLQSPTSSRWYIVYHRRPLGETDRDHRVVSIDEMHFDDRGYIRPVRITHEGVRPDPVRRPE